MELVRRGDKVIPEACRDLDPTATTVRSWVRQAEIDKDRQDRLTTTEHEELARLRKENRVLREERDILKRATAFFERETRCRCSIGSS